jgi:hypothetical protein
MGPEECPNCPKNDERYDFFRESKANYVYLGDDQVANKDNGEIEAIGPLSTLSAPGNESRSGFFSGLWSWVSGWVSPGSAQSGTDNGYEVMGLGGGNNTSEGSASKIFDMANFPSINIPIASTVMMKNLSQVSSDAYNAMNIITSQAEAVTIGLEFAETFQSGMERREKNVVDTQEWKVGNFIIRHRVESYLDSLGKGGGAKGRIIDTPYIIKY